MTKDTLRARAKGTVSDVAEITLAGTRGPHCNTLNRPENGSATRSPSELPKRDFEDAGLESQRTATA